MSEPDQDPAWNPVLVAIHELREAVKDLERELLIEAERELATTGMSLDQIKYLTARRERIVASLEKPRDS